MPPEFFFDRSLGRVTARGLKEAGWIIHLIADEYPDDAQRIPDEDWIARGCARGWPLLSKDQKIRYRQHEIGALEGFLFCLANGNLSSAEMTSRFLLAEPAILRALGEAGGFWHVYDGGRIRRLS